MNGQSRANGISRIYNLLSPLVLAVTFALLFMAAARADLPQYDRVLLVDSPVAITFAELMDQNGDSFDIDQLHGKVSFVLFGFTNCPDICPMVLQRMRQFQVAVNKNDSVAFVMVSVDAERDSPAAMKDYLSTYSAEFIGLTGDVASIRATAQQFSAAFFKNEPADDSGNYDVSHSGQLFVVDTTGRLRAELYNASLDAMEGIAAALLAERSAAISDAD